MTDLPTLIVPNKLAWERGENENITQIMPGPPDTTMDRSAIGDHEAQDVLNGTTVNGVWQLDQRYRQFAPSPNAGGDTVYTDASATIVITHCLTGADLTQAWTA